MCRLRLGDLATSPEAACTYLHKNEFGAQGGHIWKLFSEAQHNSTVGKPALVVIELLQLWKDMRGKRRVFATPGLTTLFIRWAPQCFHT